MARHLPDDWEKLLLFKDVVDQGGFSHAARYRGVTHSSVSKQLKALEHALGVTLLERSSRSMTLTEAGIMAYQHSQQIHGHLEDLLNQLEVAKGDIQGELRVGSLIHVGKHLVQPAVASFLKAYPSVSVSLKLDDGPLDFTRHGYDLAIRVGAEAEGSLRARKLMPNRVSLVASPDFLKKYGQPQHPERLVDFPTVAYESSLVSIETWSYLEAGESKTVDIRPVFRVGDGNALLDAVLEGVGIGYLSTFAVEDHLQNGTLERVLPDWQLPEYKPVYLIRGRAEHLSPRSEAFIQHLEARVRCFEDAHSQ